VRAFVKGAGLWALGWMPGGAALYRKATRDWMGTQATHVDKLSRVVPGYATVFAAHGIALEGARLAVYDPGLTPFWPMACWLLSGRESHHLQGEAHFLDKYVSRAAGGVLDSLIGQGGGRYGEIEPLRWAESVENVLATCHATQYRDVKPNALPLQDQSVDLLHSGGVLEHLKPGELQCFLREAFRVLARGGTYSAVHDHRDHLYHADKRIEPMNHLRHSEPVYRLLYGHRLLYHNRLPPSEVVRMIEDAGFEQVAMRRMVLPEQKYVSDEEVLQSRPGCSRPSGRHRSTSPLDLRTAACHYIYRKP
jgi:SAM-dependent methyltransferase